MTKRKKVILLCLAIATIACLGITIPLLVGGENSSQSSTTDTSSTEVSVSMSTPLFESSESASEAKSEFSSDETSSEDTSSESEETSSNEISVDSTQSSEETQTSDSMSEMSASTSSDTSSVEDLQLCSCQLSIPLANVTTGIEYGFIVPETGMYGICSQSTPQKGEGLALVYTLGGKSGYITSEKQTFFLQKGDFLFLTAYVFDTSLFHDGVFLMDLTVTRQLVLGENILSAFEERVVYFTPPTSGEYLFTASEGVHIYTYSYEHLRNVEVTGPLSLSAGEEIRLVLYADGETTATITITKQ